MKTLIQIKLRHQYIFVLVLSALIHFGCKKEWLDEKPNLALVVPSSISDYQALLDNTRSSTGGSSVGGRVGFNVEQIFSNEIGAGDFFISDASYDAINSLVKNIYTWNKDIYTSDIASSIEWNTLYKKIYYSNIVLEGIETITPKNNQEQISWNQVKGSALFFRAYNHYEAAQLFCKPFDKSNSGVDMGIPLRLQSDINIPSERSTIQQTYDVIISDLTDAEKLLPVIIPDSRVYKLRPTKNAVSALLSRVYLAMSNYDSAFKYADKALSQYNHLLDYNKDLNSSYYYIPLLNDEVIFHTTRYGQSILTYGTAFVDSGLFKLYDTNDLRRYVFFRPSGTGQAFQGGYDQNISFTGLATDELYLIRSECLARRGDKDGALLDLNTLYQKRWVDTVAFSPITASNTNEALLKILNERRKELCFRGIRWSDLRRLNKEDQFAVTLSRTVNGQTFTLAPNDNRYVLPFPPDVIALSKMQQNPR